MISKLFFHAYGPIIPKWNFAHHLWSKQVQNIRKTPQNTWFTDPCCKSWQTGHPVYIWARKSLCVYKSCKIQDWVCRRCFSHTLHSRALTQFWMKKLYHGCTTNWMSWHLILFTFCFMYPGYHPICMFSNLIPGLHYCLLTSKWLPDADSSCQLSVNNAGIFTM